LHAKSARLDPAAAPLGRYIPHAARPNTQRLGTGNRPVLGDSCPQRANRLCSGVARTGTPTSRHERLPKTRWRKTPAGALAWSTKRPGLRPQLAKRPSDHTCAAWPSRCPHSPWRGIHQVDRLRASVAPTPRGRRI